MRSGPEEVPAAICPAMVTVATRMPYGSRAAPNNVAGERRAALPRETVARHEIGWSAILPPVTRMVPKPAARMAGAATWATTMALMTSTEYAVWRWATLELSSRSGAPRTAL